MEGFLTVDEAADKAKVAPGSVRRWLDDPKVPLTKHKAGNGRVRVSEAELDEWLRARDTLTVVPATSPAATGPGS